MFKYTDLKQNLQNEFSEMAIVLVIYFESNEVFVFYNYFTF